jgi:drug/metabolite transporter (DMT)-like permease
MQEPTVSSRTLALPLLLPIAMLAFAGNSLLARAALVDGINDPVSFAAVRVISGAVLLGIILVARRAKVALRASQIATVLALLGYLLGFSLAYRSVSAASGAFILFPTIQLTMIAIGLVRGDRIKRAQIVGVAIALTGLGWLLAPGLTAPPVGAAVSMIVAGLSWAAYSVVGANNGEPLTRTAFNFVGAGLVMAAMIPFIGLHLDSTGWMMAVLSGTVTSGLGYIAWYAVLPHLSRITAATAQLSVPVIVAVGGTLLLGEAIGARLLMAGALILAGISLTVRR